MVDYDIPEDYSDILTGLYKAPKWMNNISKMATAISDNACKLDVLKEFFGCACDDRRVVLIEIFGTEILKRNIAAVKIPANVLELLYYDYRECRVIIGAEVYPEFVNEWKEKYEVTVMETRMEMSERVISGAIKSGDTEYYEMVCKMFDKGVDTNETSLSLASKSGSAEMLLKLDAAKTITLADVRDKNCYMLMSVCQHGHIDIIEMFVDRFGVDKSPVVWNPKPEHESLIIDMEVDIKGSKKTIGQMILPTNAAKPYKSVIWFRKLNENDQYKSWQEEKIFYEYDADYFEGLKLYKIESEKRLKTALSRTKRLPDKLCKFDIGANNFYAINRMCEFGHDEMLDYVIRTFALVKEDICNRTDLDTFPPTEKHREKIREEEKAAADAKRKPVEIPDERTFEQFFMLCDVMTFVRKFSTLKLLLNMPNAVPAKINRRKRRAVAKPDTTKYSKDIVIVITTSERIGKWKEIMTKIRTDEKSAHKTNLAGTAATRDNIDVIYATNYITSVITEPMIAAVKLVITDPAIDQTNRQIANRHLSIIWRLKFGVYDYKSVGVIDVINKQYGEYQE